MAVLGFLPDKTVYLIPVPERAMSCAAGPTRAAGQETGALLKAIKLAKRAGTWNVGRMNQGV